MSTPIHPTGQTHLGAGDSVRVRGARGDELALLDGGRAFNSSDQPGQCASRRLTDHFAPDRRAQGHRVTRRDVLSEDVGVVDVRIAVQQQCQLTCAVSVPLFTMVMVDLVSRSLVSGNVTVAFPTVAGSPGGPSTWWSRGLR